MKSIHDCGLMLEPQLGMSMDLLLETARLAEKLGFSYLFRSDHLLPTDGRRGLDSPECWTSLGAIAASTSSLKFGPLVTPVGFRNPALLAKMACTLHSFSGGRLQLALGMGWYEAEYKALGYDFPPFKVRRAQFNEALAVVVPMLREGKADFDGKHFRAHTDSYPRPVGKVHLIIGGRTKSAVKAAARSADEWNSLVSPPEFMSERKALLESLSGGRSVEVSEMGPFMVGKTQASLVASARKQLAKMGQQGTPEELLKRLIARGAACGTPDDFVATLQKKTDAGVGKFYFQTLVPENTEMIGILADLLRSGF